VTHLATILVSIGAGVLFSTYVGTVCWIFTGERISRRIREYVAFLGDNIENTFKQFSVKISLSSID
jgi:hypothetical protein